MEKVEMDEVKMDEVEMDEVEFKLVVVENQKEEGTIKSKAIKIGEIALDSVKRTIKSPLSYMAVGISALNEGLKEGNDYKDGIKSAMVTTAWLAGLGVSGDIIAKRDEIKKA